MDNERCLYGWVGLAPGRLKPQPGSLGPGTLGLQRSPPEFLTGPGGLRDLIICLGTTGLSIGVPGLIGGLEPCITWLPLPVGRM